MVPSMRAVCRVHYPVVEDGLGQTEVGQEGTPVRCEQGVGRLEIPVDDPSLVRVPQSASDLVGVVEDVVRMHRPVTAHAIGQRAPARKRHNEVRGALPVAHAQRSHHGRMIHVVHVPGFVQEPPHVRWLPCQLRADHLDRDSLARVAVDRREHTPHAPFADDLFQVIAFYAPELARRVRRIDHPADQHVVYRAHGHGDGRGGISVRGVAHLSYPIGSGCRVSSVGWRYCPFLRRIGPDPAPSPVVSATRSDRGRTQCQGYKDARAVDIRQPFYPWEGDRGSSCSVENDSVHLPRGE